MTMLMALMSLLWPAEVVRTGSLALGAAVWPAAKTAMSEIPTIVTKAFLFMRLLLIDGFIILF